MRVFETLRAYHPNLTIRGFYTSIVLPSSLELRFVTLRIGRPEISPAFMDHLFAGEVRESGERVGFEVVTLDGRSGPLSSSKVSRWVSPCYLGVACFFWFHLSSTVHLGNWDLETCLGTVEIICY